MAEEQEAPKEVLKQHKNRPWMPDTLGHRQANKIGTRIGRREQEQLEDRTKAMRRELGISSSDEGMEP